MNLDLKMVLVQKMFKLLFFIERLECGCLACTRGFHLLPDDFFVGVDLKEDDAWDGITTFGDRMTESAGDECISVGKAYRFAESADIQFCG